jgi:GxxExxY protein
MIVNEISGKILDAPFKIHKKLGPGLFESVYEQILKYELINTFNLKVVCQLPVPIFWDKIKFDVGFRADMIVEDLVMVEIKSVLELAPVHKKQLLTYVRLADCRLGLLLNFNEKYLRNGINRVANDLY